MTWTADIMPDDALDPDSLVGRMLRCDDVPPVEQEITGDGSGASLPPFSNQPRVGEPLPLWQEWPGGECPRCGYQDLEIQNTAEHGWATDGDPIRCCRCGLVGWMNVDAEDSCVETFPDDYEDLPEDWDAPPSATPEPLPLWRVMDNAGAYIELAPITHSQQRHVIAAEIEALRDWLLPERPRPTWPAVLDEQWHREQRLRARLTEQARIARSEP